MARGHQVHILSGSRGGGARSGRGRAGGVRSDQNSLPRTTWMERDLRAQLTVGRGGLRVSVGAPACDGSRPIVIKAPRSDTDHFHPRSICPSTDCPGPTPTWHQVPPATGLARAAPALEREEAFSACITVRLRSPHNFPLLQSKIM